MKQKLLFFLICLSPLTIKAQTTIWNFGGDATNFPVTTGLAANTSTTINKLTITAGTTPTNMGAVSASSKTFTDANSTAYTFTNVFKFNGGGYTGASDADSQPSVFTPTQRFLSFATTGNSTIYAIGITGSSSSSRKVFVTDGAQLIGTLSFPAGSSLNDATVTYTGTAKTLYLYCNASVNMYYLSATNVTTASPSDVKDVFKDKGVVVNGNKVKNPKKIKLYFYNMLGHLIATTEDSEYSLDNLPTGMYIMKGDGINGAMKVIVGR